MSLIHLEKSVLTFHFKEILEDGHGNHPLVWVGLGVLVLGPKLLPSLGTTSQPAAPPVKKASPPSRRSEIPLSQWVAEAKLREMSAASSRVVDAEVHPLSMFN